MSINCSCTTAIESKKSCVIHGAGHSVIQPRTASAEEIAEGIIKRWDIGAYGPTSKLENLIIEAILSERKVAEGMSKALKNIRMLASSDQKKDPEGYGHILRFCKDAGFEMGILREQNSGVHDVEQFYQEEKPLTYEQLQAERDALKKRSLSCCFCHAEVAELRQVNKVAHELFATESDKLGSIVASLTLKLKKAGRALRKIQDKDGAYFALHGLDDTQKFYEVQAIASEALQEIEKEDK